MLPANMGRTIRWLWRWLPLLERLRGYRLHDLKSDVRAGANVALLDFPQGMAYAMIAGLPVQTGVYSSALGSTVGPWFASSRFLMLGPTNATAIVLLSSMASLGLPEERRLLAIPLLLLMIAAFFFIGAAMNAGIIVKYISRSVITGYVTAGGLLIVANQLRHVLGIETPSSSTFWSMISGTIARIEDTDFVALAIGAATYAFYAALRRWARGLPTVAVTLVVIAVAAHFVAQSFGLELQSLRAVPTGTWPVSLPVFSFELLGQLASPALAVAFLSLLESASIAKTLGARSGDTVDVRQQMISMGFANVANAFGTGMPVSGSLTRSALNWSSGARTPVSSLVSGAILVVGILTIGPLLGFIPRAALSALVIAVGIGLIDIGMIRSLVRTTPADAATFAVTVVGGLLFPLDTAIFAGVVTSLLFFLHKVAQPRLVEYAFNKRGELAEKTDSTAQTVPAVSIVHVEGDLFFGSADMFLEQMRLLVQTEHLKVILLRMRNAHHLDATSTFAIAEMVKFARQKGRDVVVSGLQSDAEVVFRRSGLFDLIGEENIFPYTPENVTLSTRDALKRAQKIIGGEKAEIILFAAPKTPEE